MEQGTGSATDSPGARALTIALLLVVVLGVLGNHRGLWTPDEPREAEIAREMFLHPSIVPTLGNEPFTEKPPLFYWAVAAVFGVAGGPSATAARVVSVLAGWGTLLIVFAWGRRAGSAAAGLVAALMLATTVEFLVSCHWVLIDPLLMLLCALAFWSVWELTAGGGSRWFVALLHGSLVLALLAKGVVGPAVVLVGIASYCVVAYRDRPWRRLALPAGAATLILSIAALAFAMYHERGAKAVWEWLWVNHVERFIAPAGTGHDQPLYYYVHTLPLILLPWTVSLIALFRPSFWRRGDVDRTLPADPTKRLLIATVVGPLALLTLSATKRDIYLMPLLPSLFLLLAFAEVRRWDPSSAAARTRWSAWLRFGFFAVWGAAPAVGLMVYDRRPYAGAIVALVVAAVIVVLGVRAVLGHARQRAWVCELALASLTALTILIVGVPRIDREKDMAPFVTWLDTQLPPGAAIAVIGRDETTEGIVPFVSGRWTTALPDLNPGDPLPPLDTLPEFVLFRPGEPTERDPRLDAAYDLIRETHFGPERVLSLWRKRAADGSSATRTPPKPVPPAAAAPH